MNIIKFYFAIIISIVPFYGSTQAYFKASFVGTPQPGTCNNTIACEVYNFTSNSKVELIDHPDHFIQVVNHLDTIYNFCYETTNGLDDNYFRINRSNGYYYSPNSPVKPVFPRFEFSVTNYVAPSTSNSYDGSLTVQFDSTITDDYFVPGYIADNDTVNMIHQFTDDYTVQFDSLNRGYLIIQSIDTTVVPQQAEIPFFIGELDSYYIDTGLQVNRNYQHSNTNCEAFIELFPVQQYSGSNMMVAWHDRLLGNDMSQYYLCPGLYSYHVIEGTPAQHYGGHIDTLVITDSNLSFIDSSLVNNEPADTVSYQMSNCSFNYYNPIDSVILDIDTIAVTQDSLFATFQLEIHQYQIITYVNDYIATDLDSLTAIDIILYCDSSSLKSAFRSKQFLISMDKDGAIISNDLSLSKLDYSHVSIYPVPLENFINIEMKDGSNIEAVHLLDGNGKRVLFKNTKNSKVNLDVSALPSGSYFLWFMVNGNWYNRKLSK